MSRAGSFDPSLVNWCNAVAMKKALGQTQRVFIVRLSGIAVKDVLWCLAKPNHENLSRAKL